MDTTQPAITQDISFRIATPNDPAIISLTTALEVELNSLYSNAERIASQADESKSTNRPPKLTYIIAESTAPSGDREKKNAQAFGCIAFFFPPPAFFPEYQAKSSTHSPCIPLKVAELTRMYIHPSARRSGLSKRLLEQLEKTLRETHGVHILTLRTGVRQIPAIRMYEKAGYTKRGLYGTYVGGGVEDGRGGVSYAMQKDVRRTRESE